MSEKQFKLSSETVLQYQIMDNDSDLNENEVVDLLNRQTRIIKGQDLEIQRLLGELEKIPKSIREVWLEE